MPESPETQAARRLFQRIRNHRLTIGLCAAVLFFGLFQAWRYEQPIRLIDRLTDHGGVVFLEQDSAFLSRQLPRFSWKSSEVNSVFLENTNTVQDFEQTLTLLQPRKLSVDMDDLPPSSFHRLADNTHLTTLKFFSRHLSDEDLLHIGRATRLKNLDLNYVSLQHHLQCLHPVRNLESLTLTGHVFREIDELRHLAHLHDLEVLGLSESTIKDAMLKHLPAFSHLKILDLHYTRISDNGLLHLQKLTELTSLDLDSTRISDNGLLHLQKLTELTRLDLNNTRITDAGLVHLVVFKKLRTLSTYRTAVTSEGLKRLAELLPQLEGID